MDLLGSILNSMDKPPSVSEKQKALLKKHREDVQRQQKLEAEKLKRFREEIEEKVNKFVKDETATEYKLPPMEQVYRSIVYDVAEVANIMAQSFGEEGIDKYIMLFKKEHAPCEDKVHALRHGREWNEEIAKKVREERKRKAEEEEEERSWRKLKKLPSFVPNSNYKDKYEHLIGKEAALAAARKTEANSSYGYVPSENKKDQRSIEQTLADIRAKKKRLEASTELNKQGECTSTPRP